MGHPRTGRTRTRSLMGLSVPLLVALAVNGIGGADVGHGRVAGAKHRSLERGRQKARAEVVETARGNQSAVENNEAGQILVVTA